MMSSVVTVAIHVLFKVGHAAVTDLSCVTVKYLM